MPRSGQSTPTGKGPSATPKKILQNAARAVFAAKAIERKNETGTPSPPNPGAVRIGHEDCDHSHHDHDHDDEESEVFKGSIGIVFVDGLSSGRVVRISHNAKRH